MRGNFDLKRWVGLTWKIGVFAAGLTVLPAHAQYEDLVDLPDAPTRTPAEKGMICTIEGVQYVTQPSQKEKGGKEISIMFLLTKRPSAYFNYYDAQKKAVVFDFYDTHVGQSIMTPIHDPPFTNSTIQSLKVDLNKDVEGLKPDIRDVVRVSLFTPYDLQYDVQDDESVIAMNFKWSPAIEQKFKNQKKAIYWKFPLALAAAGGLGFAAYELWLQPSNKNTTDPIPGYPPPRP